MQNVELSLLNNCSIMKILQKVIIGPRIRMFQCYLYKFVSLRFLSLLRGGAVIFKGTFGIKDYYRKYIQKIL